MPDPAANAVGGPTNQTFALRRPVPADQRDAARYQFAPDKTAQYTPDAGLRRDRQHHGARSRPTTIVQPSGSRSPAARPPTTSTYAYDGAAAARADAHRRPDVHATTPTATRPAGTDDRNGQRRTIVWDEENRIRALPTTATRTRYKYNDDGDAHASSAGRRARRSTSTSSTRPQRPDRHQARLRRRRPAVASQDRRSRRDRARRREGPLLLPPRPPGQQQLRHRRQRADLPAPRVLPLRRDLGRGDVEHPAHARTCSPARSWTRRPGSTTSGRATTTRARASGRAPIRCSTTTGTARNGGVFRPRTSPSTPTPGTRRSSTETRTGLASTSPRRASAPASAPPSAEALISSTPGAVGQVQLARPGGGHRRRRGDRRAGGFHGRRQPAGAGERGRGRSGSGRRRLSRGSRPATSSRPSTPRRWAPSS